MSKLLKNTLNESYKDIMRNSIYNDGDSVYSSPQPYKGEITPAIEDLLESLYKLTKLFKAMLNFNSFKALSYVQPYFEKSQHLRCYLSKSYIVVEVNDNPTNFNSNWSHIIEKHNADVKSNNKASMLSIIPNLPDEVIEKINIGIHAVIETVEQYIFDKMNNNSTVFEKIKMIRIGDKTEDELKEEALAQAWANIEVLKIEKQFNVAAKAKKRKEWWNKFFGIFGDSKIKFH